MNAFAWFATSALIAVGVAAFARQRGWGMALPVVIIGAVIGALPIGPDAPPDAELILVLILAPLVFGEALSSSYLDLRRVSRPVLVLAVGLVLATTIVIGGAINLLVAAPVVLAFALGAVLAPTDAVAVSAVAKRASLDRRLVSILEGESLVNDATGLTVLRVTIVVMLAGSVTATHVAGVFALAIIGGIAVGAVGGAVLSYLTSRMRDSVAANGLVIIAPFALYLVAEKLEGSGILAVVIAALWIAHAQSSRPERYARLEAVEVWRNLTFLLQAMAFFLVGLELSASYRALGSGELQAVLVLVPIVVLLLIAVRFAFVMPMFAISAFFGRHRRGFVKRYMRGAVVISWAGARGPVSGLAALSIPLLMADGTPVPHRTEFMAIVFTVIVITLLLSQTLGPLARRLGATSADRRGVVERVNVTLLHAAQARLDELWEQADSHGTPLPNEAVQLVRDDLQVRIAEAERSEMIAGESPDTVAAVVRDLKIATIRAQQEELLRIRDAESLPDAIYREILAGLELRMKAARDR